MSSVCFGRFQMLDQSCSTRSKPCTATVLSKLIRCYFEAVWPQSEFLDFQQISLLLYIFYAAVSLFESHIKSITYSYFHLQVLNFKDLPQVKSLVCLHMEKLAVCWHHCQSAHTGMTRLKNPGNQPALLPDAVWFWAGETADTLTRLITAARYTHCINASLLFCNFSWK